MPGGLYVLSALLDLPSSFALLLDPAATLRASPSFPAQQAILRARAVSGVTVSGGAIDGNRANNPNGQLLGIQVYSGCSDVRLLNVTVKGIPADSTGGNFGDGIYVGTSAGSGLAPAKVKVLGCTVTDCVRNCISVTAGVEVTISDNHLENAAGNEPGAAVDIEPNSALDPTSDILVSGNVCYNVFHGIRVTGAVGNRVRVADNDLYGQGDNSVDAQSNPSYGVYLASTAADVTVVGNGISNFNVAKYVACPDTPVIGNTVSSCRQGLQVSADRVAALGNIYRSVWGENPIKVQGHRLTFSGNKLYDCIDTSRLAALAPPVTPAAVVVLNDGYLHGILTHNTVHDDRSSNNAAVGVRLSSTASDLDTWAIGPNDIHGATAQFSNTQSGTIGASRQWNPSLGVGSFRNGQVRGNLLTVTQASFEAGTTGWGNATGCTMAQSTDRALGGANSLKLTATTTGANACRVDTFPSVTVTVTPGETYTAGIAYWTASGAATGVEFQFYGVDQASTQQVVGQTNLVTVADGWQFITVTATIPAAYKAQAALRFRFTPTNSGDVLYLDCASITPGYGQHWQNAGQAVAEHGPNWWVLGGTSTNPQPIFVGAKGAAPLNLNVIGGTGGVRFGDGNGNTVAQVRGDGSLLLPHLADSAAANDSVYYSTTAGKLAYKDAAGTVNALY